MIEYKLFNTPLELGIRCLMILAESTEFDQKVDLHRLMYLDHLILNTGDIGAIESLHAPVPNRGVQVYAKHNLIQSGISVIASKNLIDISIETDGFYYRINDNGIKFLNYFESKYAKKLSHRIKWTLSEFGNLPTGEIKTFIDTNLGSWGGEFIQEKTK